MVAVFWSVAVAQAQNALTLCGWPRRGSLLPHALRPCRPRVDFSKIRGPAPVAVGEVSELFPELGGLLGSVGQVPDRCPSTFGTLASLLDGGGGQGRDWVREDG